MRFLFFLASCVLALSAHAIDYRTVGTATILYDAPSQRGVKQFVIRRDTPVEVVVSLDGWSKVRDAEGGLAWIEKKFLVERRSLIVTATRAAIRQSSDESSTLVFEAEKNVDESMRLPQAIVQVSSRWVPIQWHELPGWSENSKYGVSGAWKAWLKSCEMPATAMANLCADVRRLGLSSSDVQIAWMKEKLQPYRVENLQGQSEGLLTSYFEPEIVASRILRPGFTVPLYRPPANLGTRGLWHTRQEMDSVPQVKAKLRGYEIAYVTNPIGAMILQVQGSGRINMLEADGTQRKVRLAYAATNEQPYKSIGRWRHGSHCSPVRYHLHECALYTPGHAWC